ncbi:hypothetical protein [Streptomyces filamentosus]|uniref:hypothetical protein n=1 Tax=Streptomyces filamentosus TaxID=67294 RepID=UPI00340B6137
MSTPAPMPPVKSDDTDDAPQLSKSAAVLVTLVAFAGAILATVDVFVNGWLAALAHVGWFIGIFLTIALVLGVFLAFVLGSRQTARSSAPAGTP